MNHPLRQIYFYLTSGCNLRCRHCWIAPGGHQEAVQNDRHLSMDLFCSILRQADSIGCRSIKLTGGEPLLHPRIDEMLDQIRDLGFSLNVETNGTLCTPQLAEKIAVCKDVFVSVSLDGTDRATHDWIRGVGGSFERAVSGIRTLVDAGVRPQLILSVLKKNRAQIEPFVEMAVSLGASSVKLNVVQPVARAKNLYESGLALDIRALLDIGAWVEGSAFASAGIPVLYHHPPAFRPLGRMFGTQGDGCSTCGILGILGVLADGSYALCGIGQTVPELIFAHAESSELKEVWETTTLLNEIRQGLPNRFKGICRDCLMKEQCLGSCIAHNYYRSGDLWAPFWYCEEAQRIGRFPVSRLRPVPVRENG